MSLRELRALCDSLFRVQISLCHFMLEMIIMVATAEMTVDIITHVFCYVHQSLSAVQPLLR